MALTPGTKLGPYEIQSAIGAGGMGEVYSATDSRLERRVAIKVLPAHLTSDPSLRQRLEREAKAVSRLSHPHICTLHDVGHQDGMDFLVMELVQGETLEQRLAKGPLPIDQTLRLSAQISDALAKAHQQGITHRDLKPSNIMLTKSGAKLMDFGLAKDIGPASPATALTELTVVPPKLTTEGAIVGTFQYMAPEQLEGKEADARTDIFALGAVIYEMVTGRPAFTGKSKASLIAAILSADPPPISAMQPMTPAALDRLVKKCLAKDPEERWQSASDLAEELRWIGESPAAVSSVKTPGLLSHRERLVWGAISMILLLVVLFNPWERRAEVSQQLPAYYLNSSLPFPASDVTLSPDARLAAIVAYSAPLNSTALWLHNVGSPQATLLEGTEGTSYPFWSPDGKYIGFFAKGKLKKIDVVRKEIQVICDAPNGRGGTWNREGVILFNPAATGTGLFRVSSAGGVPTEVTKVDLSRFETTHRWPVFLPDGKHFIYLAANFTGRTGNNMLYVGSLDSKEKRFVVNSSSGAAYAEPGYLVYMREDKSVVAQKFDLRNYALIGEPRIFSDEVMYYSGVAKAVFTAVNDKVMIVQKGNAGGFSRMTWFDRSGKSLGNIGGIANFQNVRLSRAHSQIAVEQTDLDGRNIDIWIYDAGRGTSRRLTFDPALDQMPVWSPDGKFITYGNNRNLRFELFMRRSDGAGTEEKILDVGETMQVGNWDWSRDGRYALVRRGNELWVLSVPDKASRPLLQGPHIFRTAQFSPDSKWIAYASNETGKFDIYVSPFPDMNGKWQISNGGGEEPKWRGDGREIFYLAPDGTLMAVPVSLQDSVETGNPVALFQTHRHQQISAQDLISYDVMNDGQRFLVITNATDTAPAPPFSVVLNWASEFEK